MHGRVLVSAWIVIGVVLALGIGYVAWQVFR